jgi:hypothetical protein
MSVKPGMASEEEGSQTEPSLFSDVKGSTKTLRVSEPRRVWVGGHKTLDLRAFL